MRFAAVTLALSLLAAATSAEPYQDGKPKTDSPPAKVQDRAGARQGGKQADRQRTDRQQVDSKKAKTKRVGAAQTDSKKIETKRAGAPQTDSKKVQTKRAGTPQTDTKKVETKKVGAEKAQRAPQRDAESAGTPVQKRAAGGAAPAKKIDRAEMKKKLALEERKHRERVARIERLRKLATEKKQTERIAQIDALLQKENARYAKWISHGREVLGDKEFESVDAKLRKGRRSPGQEKDKPSIRTEKAGTPKKKDTAGTDRG